jgi:outer membrane protein assembly factor BamB
MAMALAAIMVPTMAFGQTSPSPDDRPATSSAGWAGFKGDAARRAEGVDGPRGEPVLRWRFQADGAVPGNVSVGGDLAYASSDDGVLHALDVVTGEERWSYGVDLTTLGGPVLAGGAVYAFDGDGVLHALDALTGEPRWRSADPVTGPSSPTVGHGAVYAGAEDGTLVAIETATGTTRWRTTIADTGWVNSPAYLDGKVYVTSEDGGAVRVDAASGSIEWRFEEAASGTAVAAQGLVYVALGSPDGATGTLWALDAATGTERWHVDRPIFTPAVAGGVAYSGSDALGVTATDIATGQELWRFPIEGVARPLGVADGVVYVPADTEHRVYALDAASGTELWRFDVDSGIDCCIAIANGAVYVGTFMGGVYAIGDAPDEAFVQSPS